MSKLLIMFGSFLILVGFSFLYDKSYKEGYSRNNVDSSTTNDNLNARIVKLIDEKINSDEFDELINIKIENFNKTDKLESRVKELFDKNISTSFADDDDIVESYEML